MTMILPCAVAIIDSYDDRERNNAAMTVCTSRRDVVGSSGETLREKRPGFQGWEPLNVRRRASGP